MKKIICLIIIGGILGAASGLLFAQSEKTRVPRVAYLSPERDSTVDLTGKNSLVLQWKNQPAPGGGREAFRFRLYKGFDYNAIVSQDLKQDVFSVEVPADKFEDGATYSWHVQQRDASSMSWSLFDTWTFTVSKKK